MKTICQALIDEIYYPIPYGKVENIIIARGLDGDEDFSAEIAAGKPFKGALADCLYSLLQAINFTEADKSIGALTDSQRKAILKKANDLYKEIGEPEVDDGSKPTVYINC